MTKKDIREAVLVSAMAVYECWDLASRGILEHPIPSEKDIEWADHVRMDLAPRVRESDGVLYDIAQNLIYGRIW